MKKNQGCIAGLILATSLLFFHGGSNSYAAPSITNLKSLSFRNNPQLKNIRKEIRRSIYIVRGRREVSQLPSLKFYRYRVKAGDTFWKILSRSNLDMDTIMTVNDLSSPGQIKKGKILYLPNMRGILVKNPLKKKSRRGSEPTHAGSFCGIPEVYISRVNGNNLNDKSHLFLPCGKLSRLQRSLFLGTGFASPIRKGRKTSGFGTRRDPFHRKRFQFHRGIDIACPVGTPIRAARNGIVTFRGYSGGYGKLMVIRHEHGYRSYYGHMSRFTASRGKRVRAGEIIGYSGNTGRSTGPHLHFEVRRGRRAVNPGHLIHY